MIHCSTSQVLVERKLNKWLQSHKEEAQEKIRISIMSPALVGNSKWNAIWKLLEKSEISSRAFESNRSFILRWFEEIFKNEISQIKGHNLDSVYSVPAIISTSIEPAMIIPKTELFEMPDKCLSHQLFTLQQINISEDATASCSSLASFLSPVPSNSIYEESIRLGHKASPVTEIDLTNQARFEPAYKRVFSKKTNSRVSKVFRNHDNTFLQACGKGDLYQAGISLSKGANIETEVSSYSNSALACAIQRNDATVVAWLLQQGKTVQSSDLIIALNSWNTWEKEMAVLNILLNYSNKSQDNPDSWYGSTPLIEAVKLNNTAVVHRLLEMGYHPELAGENRYDSDMIDGYDSPHYQKTPLEIASSIPIIQDLLDHGARPSVKALHSALGTSRNVDKAMLLLHRGADIHSVVPNDYYGDTPLHLAARWGYVAPLRLLLEKGAKLETRNNKKLTALDYAAKLETPLVLSILLDWGVKTKSLRFDGIGDETLRAPSLRHGDLLKNYGYFRVKM